MTDSKHPISIYDVCDYLTDTKDTKILDLIKELHPTIVNHKTLKQLLKDKELEQSKKIENDKNTVIDYLKSSAFGKQVSHKGCIICGEIYKYMYYTQYECIVCCETRFTEIDDDWVREPKCIEKFRDMILKDTGIDVGESFSSDKYYGE